MANISDVIQHLKFVKNKPRVLIKIFKGFFNAIILRKKVLRTIDWAITYRCNFNCSLCSAKILMDSNKDKKELTPEQIRDVWRQAEKLGVIHVNLTGGEPTLIKIDELCKIIRYMNPKKFLISLVTNGSILNEEKIRKLKDAGLDTIQLSIDSTDPETHDKIRGVKGSHEKLMKCLKWAKKYHLVICVSTVLTRDNFKDIVGLVKMTKKEGVFLLLNPVSSSGALNGKENKKMLEEDLKRYNRLLKIPHTRADTLFNFRGKGGCPAGVERIEITAYGDVMTCPHVQISYGNVLKEPLAKIYKRISNFPLLRKLEKDCRHVFNQEYIDKMIRPIYGAKKLPVSIFDHPIAKKNKEIREYLEKTR
ncbi:MAG: radical SAM protein [Nanoarchaeota archaeon]|nr:radical SAM protein [Nanoarchaeota archaeon]